MRQHGLEPGLIRACNSSRAAAAAEVGRLIEEAKPPTAFICANDLMALGAVEELKQRGLMLGAGLSVIGFDDIPEACHAVPRLGADLSNLS